MSRDNNLSCLRVIFLLWILLFHSFNEFIFDRTYFNYNIHHIGSLEKMKDVTNLVLQGFVIISGYLMGIGYFIRGKYQNVRVFFCDKVKRLLFPYIFFSFLLVILYPVSWKEVLCGAKHLWFLLMLFDVMVVFILLIPLIKKTNKWIDTFLFIFLMFISAFVERLSLPDYLSWKTSVYYLPSFFLGLMFIKYDFKQKLIKQTSIVILTCFFLSIGVFIFFINTSTLPFGGLYKSLPNYSICILFYILLCRFNKNDDINKFVKGIDKNSLAIYILHNFVGKYTLLYYCPSFVYIYDEHSIIVPLLLFVFTLFSAWGCSVFLHKFNYSRVCLGS